MNEKVVLIDGLSILNRAFYGLPRLTNSEGIPTNAVYGFLSILFKIIDEESPKYLTIAFDVNKPTFRHNMYKEYKGTRKPMPEDLVIQLPLIKEVLEAMGISIIEKPGYEADDLLGTISKAAEKKGYQVSLVSGDRDLLQLASDKIKVRIPKTKMTGTEIEDYYEEDVKEKYKVTPTEFIDVKGLMGDPSDKIPGVPGIGEKTATKIIESYGTIENAFTHLEEIKPKRAKESLEENYDIALLSKKLATLVTDCDLDFNIEEATFDNLYNEKAFVIFKNLEFKNFLNRFELDVNFYKKIEDNFKYISKLEEVKSLFQFILERDDLTKKNKRIGLQYIIDKDSLMGVSLCFEEKTASFIPVGSEISAEFIKEEINKVINAGYLISTIMLKEQLDYLGFIKEDSFFDCGIGAYLLNPLKSTYYFDDIARDYLDMTIPSRHLLRRPWIQKEMNLSAWLVMKVMWHIWLMMSLINN